MGLQFNTQKEAKYAHENWIDEGRLALEFPAIRDKIHELGAGSIFNEPERCNLTLVRNSTQIRTPHSESTRVKIKGQVVALLCHSSHSGRLMIRRSWVVSQASMVMLT
ncbi:hypothetical protein HAX54_035162 [Datura stramonium]|uniref:Uncharacterized protein n=1 Tax=Datura stramonium TaxID=4076 RepID=A0ABS8SF24_DATST|nr:hypothetical protein [Datura stramonium]